MNDKNLFFNLFANCIPVRGKKRSLICDLQCNSFVYIPNDLYNIINKFKKNTIQDVKNYYSNQFDEIIDDYFNFLIENKFIHFTSQIDSFPKLKLNWKNPAKITNAIIDIDIFSVYDIKEFIRQCENIMCQFIQLRYFREIRLEELNDITYFINSEESIISFVEFILPFNNAISEQNYIHLLIENPRIHKVVIYNSATNKFLNPVRKGKGFIIYSTKNIMNSKSCGLISDSYFSINIKTFTESLHHNSCLNRKISIDKDGNIKNCPSMPQSFGNINNTSLEEALNHKDFKKYWNVNKDMIAVCKDCEFRHICTDCRAYTEQTHFDGDIDLSKPLKCGYNPYTNVWEEWSTNPLKQKAIEYYGMQDLVKKDA
jgi:SPASM domain peptide maturase of grasp-with-spasm system